MASKNRFENIANKIIALLAENDIRAYIWCVATTGSVYIRFEDNRMCSIRIGDHNGKEKLKYKYNIRSDVKKIKWMNDNGIWRLFIPEHKWTEIIPFLIKRHQDIQSWEPSKYQYTIPTFKQTIS